MTGYSEKTYVYPRGNYEVYGQDGYGWYCDKETEYQMFPDIKTTQNKNPLFVTLEGMTAAKLRKRGFVKVSD